MGDKDIFILDLGGGDPLCFSVVVRQGGQETQHEVTLQTADLSRLAEGRSGGLLIDAAFRFLLDREPKEAILARFDLSVIARYFPEFERELPHYLGER